MRRNTIWQKPKLRCDENENLHRPVTWLELFFDIYFVVAVSQLSHEFALLFTVQSFLNLLLLFLPLIWMWIGITYYLERFETEGIENRLIVFVYMLIVGAMALFAYKGLTLNYNGYVISYIIGRLFTIFLWNRAGWHNHFFRPVVKIYNRGFSAGLILLALSLFVDPPLRFVLLALGVLVEMITPMFTKKQVIYLPKVSTSKHPERFGLFTIVVLGETVIGVIHGLLQKHALVFSDLFFGFSGVVLGFSIWWIYFDFVAKRPFKQGFPWVYVWVYLHIGIYFSIIVIGASIMNAMMFSGIDIPFNIRLMSASAVGLFLLCVGCTEYTLVRYKEEPTHLHLSSFKKIIGGLIVPFTAFLPVGKYAFFLSFYMFIFVHIIYSIYIWLIQETPPDKPRTSHI